MSEAPPVEGYFREIKRRGLRLNNLFQLNSGMWRANVRSADSLTFFEFGNGVDPSHALEEALRKSQDFAPVVRHPPLDDERMPDSSAADDEEDLIG